MGQNLFDRIKNITRTPTTDEEYEVEMFNIEREYAILKIRTLPLLDIRRRQEELRARYNVHPRIGTDED